MWTTTKTMKKVINNKNYAYLTFVPTISNTSD